MLSISRVHAPAKIPCLTATVQHHTEGAPIRVLLLDQDPISRLAIRRAFNAHRGFQLVEVHDCRQMTLDQVTALRPDALLIDVETLGFSGLDVEIFLSQHFKHVVVFLTVSKEFTMQAFELGAADYLLKPFSNERFEKALERIQIHHMHRVENASGLQKRIAVTDRRKTHLIPPNEIEWVSAAGDYTELHVSGATHLLREPFSTFLGRLPSDIFCRIHRSFAVNLTRITGFKTLRNHDLLVRLQDKTILRASRTFSGEFRRSVSQHCV